MKNIFIIPTTDISHLYKVNDKLHLEEYPHKTVNVGNHHLYIVSDEEIKKSDWVFETLNKIMFKVKNDTNDYSNSTFKKIILTTDQNLIKDGVQPITYNFLEWFVNNPNCEFINISTYHIKGDISGKLYYKLNIPQKVICTNDICQGECEDCDFMKVIDTAIIDDPKQETVEKINNRFIIVDGSLSHHCCFCYTIVDTKEGKETYGDYWKKSICETFNIEDAEIICDALNKL